VEASLKAKLPRNIGADAHGQAITFLIQLVSVPLYLHYCYTPRPAMHVEQHLQPKKMQKRP
jgi:hypothetical protein